MIVKSHKSYIVSLLIGLLLSLFLYVLGVFFQIGFPTETSKWTYEVNTIKTSISQKLLSPRIIIAAGSNGIFGVGCVGIEKEIGLSCINASTHVGLGTEYILHQTKRFLHPNDVLILPLEYELYLDKYSVTDFTLDYIISRDPSYLYSHPNLLANISIQRWAMGIVNRVYHLPLGEAAYNAKTLNSRGDETANKQSNIGERQRNGLNRITPFEPGDFKKNSHQAIQSIQDLIDWSQKNKVTVIATWPSIIKTSSYDKQNFNDFITYMKSIYRKNNIKIIGEPTDFMYDKSLFFDSIYHLNDKGQSLRTNKLISLLRQEKVFLDK
jgi:hypothetical protein